MIWSRFALILLRRVTWRLDVVVTAVVVIGATLELYRVLRG